MPLSMTNHVHTFSLLFQINVTITLFLCIYAADVVSSVCDSNTLREMAVEACNRITKRSVDLSDYYNVEHIYRKLYSPSILLTFYIILQIKTSNYLRSGDFNDCKSSKQTYSQNYVDRHNKIKQKKKFFWESLLRRCIKSSMRH